MSQTITSRLVIGGPARCGKTSLSARFAAADDTHLVLGVDALFRAILRRGIVNWMQPTRETVRHFLARQRYQDAARIVTERVLDYTALDLDTLAPNGTGKRFENPIRAYARCFDTMALAAGKTGWIVFDLHPEFVYRQLRRQIPGLKLVVMFRDPREAVAAALYWRNREGELGHRRRDFRRALLLWGMAAIAACSHRTRWPSDVRLVVLPQLLDGNAELTLFGIRARTGAGFDLSAETLHFRMADGRFLLPNGQTAPLLSEKELAEITYLLGPLAGAVGLTMGYTPQSARAGVGLRIYFGIFAALTRWNPQRAAAVLDLAEEPLGVLRRRLSQLREAAGILAGRKAIVERPT